MGVHHDNFDLWDSKYHRWNAVKMGPHGDIVVDWQQACYNRVTDLVTHYKPDLLYTDGGIPFGVTGRTLVANFYNGNIKDTRQAGGLVQPQGHRLRRISPQGRRAGRRTRCHDHIQPLPWQTDTSMGDWFYSEGYKYKTTQDVVTMPADIVSKNGNLFLNVVQYRDGSLPPESRQSLDEMAPWIKVNGEAIYGTRPWKTFGEVPTKTEGGAFKENAGCTARDIRFATRDGALYAITLGEPKGQVRIASLGARGTGNAAGQIGVAGGRERAAALEAAGRCARDRTAGHPADGNRVQCRDRVLVGKND